MALILNFPVDSNEGRQYKSRPVGAEHMAPAKLNAKVAQQVEHGPEKAGVGGSSPPLRIY